MKLWSIIKNVYIYKIWYGWIWIGSLSDWKKILVKWWALPKSTVDIKVVKNKKDYIQWHIITTHKYDKDLADWVVFCPHYFIPIWASQQNQNSHKIGCWWCKRQIISYHNQLKLKHDIIKDWFEKIQISLPDLVISPIIWCPLEKWYRNKIEFSFGVYISWKENIDNRRNLWFHKQWEFSKIVDIDSCWLISDKANKIFEYIKKLCFDSDLPVFDQKIRQWFFRHLVIREWFNTNQILVNLSVFEDNLKKTYNEKWNKFLETIQKDKVLKESITTFVITYNNWLADTVKSDKSETKILRWDWYIHENLKFSLDDNTEISSIFRISPFSFFQTNTLGAQILFSEAQKMLWYVKWTILDLYCWTWTIWINILKSGIWSNLIWIEVVEDAIIDAHHNAKINWVEDNCLFIAAQSEKVFNDNPQLKEKIKDLWAIIVDPPREWLHKNLINFLSELKKETDFKLLYISCNPITMARDIWILIDNGFKINRLQAVDMFPQTHHIEVIWMLY